MIATDHTLSDWEGLVLNRSFRPLELCLLEATHTWWNSNCRRPRKLLDPPVRNKASTNAYNNIKKQTIFLEFLAVGRWSQSVFQAYLYPIYRGERPLRNLVGLQQRGERNTFLSLLVHCPWFFLPDPGCLSGVGWARAWVRWRHFIGCVTYQYTAGCDRNWAFSNHFESHQVIIICWADSDITSSSIPRKSVAFLTIVRWISWNFLIFAGKFRWNYDRIQPDS